LSEKKGAPENPVRPLDESLLRNFS